MSATDDAIEVGKEAWRLHYHECNCGDAGHNATRIIRAAVDSGHLVAADDVAELRAALLRLGALEQIGHIHDFDQNMPPSDMVEAVNRLVECEVGSVSRADCPDCFEVYRFKGEQP